LTTELAVLKFTEPSNIWRRMSAEQDEARKAAHEAGVVVKRRLEAEQEFHAAMGRMKAQIQDKALQDLLRQLSSRYGGTPPTITFPEILESHEPQVDADCIRTANGEFALSGGRIELRFAGQALNLVFLGADRVRLETYAEDGQDTATREIVDYGALLIRLQYVVA
jgi:hypothetical protein